MANPSSVSLLPRLTVCACLTTVKAARTAGHLYLSRRREIAMLPMPGASARERTLSETGRVGPRSAETARARGNVARAERLSLDFPPLAPSFLLPRLSHAARSLESSRCFNRARRARQGVSRCRYLQLTGERKEIRLPGRRITRPTGRRAIEHMGPGEG